MVVSFPSMYGKYLHKSCIREPQHSPHILKLEWFVQMVLEILFHALP